MVCTMLGILVMVPWPSRMVGKFLPIGLLSVISFLNFPWTTLVVLVRWPSLLRVLDMVSFPNRCVIVRKLLGYVETVLSSCLLGIALLLDRACLHLLRHNLNKVLSWERCIRPRTEIVMNNLLLDPLDVLHRCVIRLWTSP